MAGLNISLSVLVPIAAAFIVLVLAVCYALERRRKGN